ncbi:MAG: DUF2793 domain-containing protein [Pseudomonadota bacterium]
MFETYQLGLPLVQPAQAQKHVTVNEAIARLDALAQLRVVAADLTTPPVTALDGESYLVGAGAGETWQGRDRQVAIFSNGGWVFATPKMGWRAWDEARATTLTFDGTAWIENAIAVSVSGAATRNRVVELTHTLSAGASSVTTAVIPSHASVVGVTARVLTAISGAGVGSWSLGVPGAVDRYGSGLGLAAGSFALGISGTPVTYYAPTELQITADAGSFDGGVLSLAVHCTELLPPRAA